MTAVDKMTKAAQFVTKLLQLTQEKRIDWRLSSSPRDDGRTAFVADVEDKTLRIYKYPVRIAASDTGDWFGSPTRTRTVETTCLEVLDGGFVAYTFEDVSGLGDLYETVAYAASDVEALMDTILEKN